MWPNSDSEYADQLFFLRCPQIYIGGGYTINNNGAFTLTTALTRAYAHCYMYFDANRIAAGVPAGWYYVQMTTASAGTIFNNVYTLGNCSIPTTPTPFVTTGGGAGANPLSTAIAGFNFNFVGGSMGNNGILTMEGLAITPVSASVKDLTANFDSTVTAQYGLTNFNHYSFSTPLRNMGEQIRQSAPRQNTGGRASGGGTNSDLNMMWNHNLAINRNFNFKFNVAAVTDYIVLLALDVIIQRID